MDDPIINNISIQNGINRPLNVANDMDADVISYRNSCVSKPPSVHTDVRVDSEYWPKCLFDVGLVDAMYIIFPGIHKPIDNIQCGASSIVINTISC